MLRLRSFVILAAVAAASAATLASAAAGPGLRMVSRPPVLLPWHGGERHALWRNHEGDRDAWRRDRSDRSDLLGSVGDATEPGPKAPPSPFVVAAPVTVNVTFAPAGGSPPDWSDGPKLIEIGRSAPPRRHFPLVVYGD